MPTDIESESRSDEERVVTVSVSPNGQATIPKEFRDRLGIEAPGRVRFRETEDGEIVIERVPTVEEMKGFAARIGESTTERSASEILHEKREREKQERKQQDLEDRERDTE